MIFQIVLLMAFAAVCLYKADAAPLDDYVWRHDDAYGWVEMGEQYNIGGEGHGFTGYLLNMTSQRWLTDADFSPNSDSKSLWWHYLMVVVPNEVDFQKNASIWITGGNNPGSPPKATDEDIWVTIALAMTTKTVCAALFQIPNQHIIFAADPIQKSRSEDAVIAFTWDHFLSHPDQPEWLVRFPMVKASVRAMDAVTEFMEKKFPEKEKIESWAVAGASKRGWTTWLVGAVDPARVKVIVPIVLDAINFIQVEHHEYRSLGGWSFALQDYMDMNIMARIDDPNMLILSQNEDPYFFKERLTMPKLVINAVLDEFQQPDDTHYWWNDMPEPKHFMIVPNAEHSLITGILEVVPGVAAFIRQHLNNEVVPQFTWKINNSTGEIVATLNEHGLVHEAKVWWGYSCGTNNFEGVAPTMRRDFRVANADDPCSCGIINVHYEGYCANLKSFWSHKTLEQGKDKLGRRTYSALLDAPTDGRWVAYFVEITYKRSPIDEPSIIPYVGKGFIPKDLASRMVFTTEVSVFPNTFPYPACKDDTCAAPIV